MKYIAWETGGASAWIVGFETTEVGEPRELSATQAPMDTRCSEHLLPAIDSFLRSRGWVLSELDCVGVGVGPGSFTGLRIGIVTARTFAQALKIPICGVSSLAAYTAEVLARTGAPGAYAQIPCTSTDSFLRIESRMGEIRELCIPRTDVLATIPSDYAEGNVETFPASTFASLVSGAEQKEWKNLKPNYLRRSAAEVKLANGLLPPVSSLS